MPLSLISLARRAVPLVLALAAAMAQAAVPPAQRAWLLDLYNSTQEFPTGWNAKSGWLGGGDPCEDQWAGVGCNAANTQVIRLKFNANDMQGTLPAGDWTAIFPQMESIRLEDNFLRGPVPSVSGFTQLQRLDLRGNRNATSTGFSGPLPSIAGLMNLEIFDARNNAFTGTIAAPGSLPLLTDFMVNGNHLTGGIPDLSGLAALQVFTANDNLLNGTIAPQTLPATLLGFQIQHNQLTGPVPAAPANLSAAGSNLCARGTGEPPAFNPITVNHLDAVASAGWNAGTVITPWYQFCNYIITPNPGPHGIITLATAQTVAPGAVTAQPFEAWPDAYYLLDTLTATCPGTVMGNTFTMAPATQNCTVSATFKRDPAAPQFTVTASAGVNGAIAPAGATQVYINDPLALTLTPAPGYAVDQVTGTCGGTLNGNVFTTAAVTQNCTVAASFKLAPVGAAALPTLGEWALALLALLLAAAAAVPLRRR